ncbi:MAG: OmpA family protein [Cyclobacteriaceae bacterium]|nr:OmpA family protein [Cyclobacteriaceae bacterium HetDA_MAG_MS6]
MIRPIIATAIATALFLTTGTNSFAQKVEKIYKVAEQLFYEELPAEALPAYQDVLSINPKYADAQYKAELCILLTSQREKSLENLMSLRKTLGRKDRFFHYWLGRIYVHRYDFDRAIGSWKTFLKQKGYKSKEIVSETKDFIQQAKDMIAFFENTDQYEIHQLDGAINTASTELTPAYFKEKEELLFASDREQEGIFKIYHATKQGDSWGKISEIPVLGDFSRQHANLEVVDEDGKLFVFNPEKGGDLFFSETRNGKWVAPVEFDSKITSTHLQSHFFINEHEDRIIFSSDKHARTHGLDLFQSFRDHKTGKWSKPAPFADIINSELDEDSPYLSHDEKTLYFSSQGHGSIGGYDVYKTEFDSVTLTWSEPVNMGFPINSPDDEMHFKMNADNTSGYFSSNRLHSKGDYDIYFFWEIEKVKIQGQIMDILAADQFDGAEIRFRPSMYTDEYFKSAIDAEGRYRTDIISDETFLVEIVQNGDIVFEQTFELHADAQTSSIVTKDFTLAKPKSETSPIVAMNTPMDTQLDVKIPSPVDYIAQEGTSKRTTTKRISKEQRETSTSISDLEGIDSVVKKAIIHNIYFDFGTSKLRRESTPVLKELYDVLSNTDINVEIGGHTDAWGPEEANQWMSRNRAEAVVKWLARKGIDPVRMRAKGYGESKPLASNDDEENGRELNRRIEVIVIE